MSKVLLLNTFYRPEATAGDYKKFLTPMPPITLAYLAAALEQADVPVAFYDDVINHGDEQSLRNAIESEKPTIIGISVVTGTVGGAERAAKIIRATDPNIKIVMGNIHADLFAETFLRGGLADVVVHEEGEATLVELAREFDKPSPDLSSVAGISFIDGAEVYRTPTRPFLEDLDSLPFPAWHLFPIERYRIFNFARVKEPGTLILGSRGCPFKCTFCTLIVNAGNTRRKRSVENIADEFEYLYDRFGFKQASFIDPIFPFYKHEGTELSQELIKRGLHKKMVWITETRVDLVNDDLMKEMYAGGLRRIMYGFETGSQEHLSRIRKGSTLERGILAAQAAKKAGVGVVGFFMIGIPGSTGADIDATIEYSKMLDIDFAKFTVFVPYPGTPEHRDLMEKGLIDEPENWNRYTSYPTPTRPPAFIPEGMTLDELIAYQRKAYFSFYFRPRMVFHQLFRVRTLGLSDAMGAMKLVAAPLTSRA